MFTTPASARRSGSVFTFCLLVTLGLHSPLQADGGLAAEAAAGPQVIEDVVFSDGFEGEPSPLAVGDVIFTELMPNPDGTDTMGEWFELLNVSGGALSLEGCIIEDAAFNQHVIVGPLDMAAGERLLFAVNGDSLSNGGMDNVDYVYPSQVSLNNSSESLSMNCDQTLIDSVAYDSLTWPFAAGVSMQLDPGITDWLANDNVANWCSGIDLYGDGNNVGTPGVANPSCL